MELVLGLHNGTQVQVACNGRASHTFALESLTAADPAALYNALFPPGSPACVALASAERLALVLDEDLDALPWELSRGPEGWLALQLPLVRLTPPASRHPAPKLDSPLRVLAVPSNPVARDVLPLNIAGEWRRLREAFEKLTHSVRLERVTPPTLDSLRRAALRSPQAVIHFMGHGGQTDDEAILFFESDAGGLQPITAKDFAFSVSKQAFLVTLNACVSAAPGPTQFSNLARLLVERGLPYALGMSASIPDGDALTFSRALYENLAAGVDVEQSVFQARRSLLRGNPREWLVGVPVLYSSFEAPSGGFATPAGQPQIDDGQPPLDVTVLPRAEGAFQGRIDELLTLGQTLTSEPRPKLLTIHGAGGQGKTALAREAVERFAHAWPGGVWAVSLENKPNRATFCFQLAQFLKIPTDNFPKQPDLERVILTRLDAQRTLIVLDNAETFTEAIRAEEPDALDLAAFLQERLLSTDAGLLVTSREPLGWPREQSLPLEGLSQSEGAALFTQSAPQRQTDIQTAQAAALSARLDGHPLALLLLGLAFNDTAISLEQFIAEHEIRLLNAENKYKAVEHRHRTLYASIETSTRYLSEDERTLLSKLWIFKAPFLNQTAREIFTPPDLPKDKTKIQQKRIEQFLHTLFRRGLLLRETETIVEGRILFYRNLPIVSLFAQYYLQQELPIEVLQTQIGKAYADLLQSIDQQINSSNWASYLAIRCREDLERCFDWVENSERGWYANHLGFVLQRIGDRQAGLRWLEQALEIVQNVDQKLEIHILNNIGEIYRNTGKPSKALEFYEKILLIARVMGDQSGEAASLNNIAMVYHATGQPSKALELYETSLPITRTINDKAGEAATLSNMAAAYIDIGARNKALELSEQALAMRRDIGDQAGEAVTLNNIAIIYRGTKESEKVLELYEQALLLMRIVGDQAGEAATLTNMAGVYRDMGKLNKTLELYEQALLLAQAVGDRAAEATILDNMAAIYRDKGELIKALELCKHALPLMRNVGNRMGEAVTLGNMASIYQTMNEPSKALELYERMLHLMRAVENQMDKATTLNNMGGMHYEIGNLDKALELFEQALILRRAVSDRKGEATILNNIGLIYHATHQPKKALELFEQALPIHREVGNEVMEATTLTNISLSLYSDFSRPQEAIDLLKQVIAILQKLGLSQVSSGTSTITIFQMQDMLEMMKTGQPLEQEQLSTQVIEAITASTLAALTGMPYMLDGLYQSVSEMLQEAQTSNLQAEIEFFTAILTLLDSKTSNLPAENPYAWAIHAILQKLQEPINLPALPADFVARCITGLTGEIAQKMSLADELAAMAKANIDAGTLALIDTVQRALFGTPIESLGQELSGAQAQIWQEIVRNLKV